jgi:hypothetical protein
MKKIIATVWLLLLLVGVAKASTLYERYFSALTDYTAGNPIDDRDLDGEFDGMTTALNRKVLCAASAPSSPISGQTWVDTTNKILKMYRNNEWVGINANHIGTSAMTTAQEGDLWYDSTNNLLETYDGSNWSILADFPASSAQGDIWYLSAAATLARLGKDANATRYLSNTGTSNNPAWAQVALATGVSGTLPVANGGSGATTLTDGGILLGSGTDAVTAMAVLADGEMIVGDGTTDPVAESGATLRASIGVTIGSNVQAYDADLTTYAGITPSANIQTFLGSANYAAARTNLGVAIGSDVQAYDAQLDDLADGTLSGAGTCNTSALTGTTYLPDNTVDTTALKTATGEVSTTDNATLTVTGGTYCFYPQIKSSDAGQYLEVGICGVYDVEGSNSTSYITVISLRREGGSGTMYAQFRYITTSGEDYWLFFLIDKQTKEILSTSGAPDHPAYGNSNDFEKQSHPFPSFNSNTQDIILIEKDQAKAIQTEAKEKNLSVLELVDNEYKIDFSKVYNYVPIHSGQFSPDEKPVLVKTIPDYIQVRRLLKMTEQDKIDKENRRLQREAEFEAKKAQDKIKKETILNKLGIKEEELNLLLK